MIRRTVLTAAAVLSLTLVPAAAMAYDAPGYSTTVSDSSPAAGRGVSVTVKGAKAGEKVTLTVTSTPASLSNDSIQIAGTKSLTKAADASGATVFAVTFAAGGGYDLLATDSTNAVLSTQSLTVAAAAAPAASSASAPTAAGTRAAALGDTGFDGMELAAGAGALVLAGAGAVVVARRRQTAGA